MSPRSPLRLLQNAACRCRDELIALFDAVKCFVDRLGHVLGTMTGDVLAQGGREHLAPCSMGTTSEAFHIREKIVGNRHDRFHTGSMLRPPSHPPRDRHHCRPPSRSASIALMRRLLLLALAALLLAAARPDAVPARGRRAFVDLRCHSCHRVAEDPALPGWEGVWEGPLLHDLGKDTPQAVAQRIVARARATTSMAQSGGGLNDAQLADIVAYLRNPRAAR